MLSISAIRDEIISFLNGQIDNIKSKNEDSWLQLLMEFYTRATEANSANNQGHFCNVMRLPERIHDKITTTELMDEMVPKLKFSYRV